MKKRRDITPKDILRWLAQGYGQGVGRDYRPFFHVRDVPSRGRSSMVLGLKTGRVHHYLSDLEYSCHVLAEYESTVTDIREQFALLPWEETLEIADSLGIRHPTYPGTRTPIVMTSDMVMTVKKEGKSGIAVVSVKPSSEIGPGNPRAQRTMEKLLIEKTYWSRRGIPWKLVTERDVPIVRVKNLDRLRVHMVSAELDCLNAHIQQFLAAFNNCWCDDSSLYSIFNNVATGTGLSKDECACLFGRAIWLRLLDVDLDARVIHHDLPLARTMRSGGK